MLRRSKGSGSSTGRRGASASARRPLLLPLKPLEGVGLRAEPRREPQARELALCCRASIAIFAEPLVPGLHPRELRQLPPRAARGDPPRVDLFGTSGPAAFPRERALVRGAEELLARQRGAEGADGFGREVGQLLVVEEAA